jgi:hypothetical protein
VGSNELRLIEEADFLAFPPRLPEQPIFYLVLTFEYAEQIARDWDSKDARHANVGYVTEFDVLMTTLSAYEEQQVSGRVHRELWVPAQDLGAFNRGIIGPIRVVAEYRHGDRVR